MGAGRVPADQGLRRQLGHQKLIECLAPNRRVTVDVRAWLARPRLALARTDLAQRGVFPPHLRTP